MLPLTHEERSFLDAYVFEATNGPPFGGPATRDLATRDIYYEDLSWILTAYSRELSAEGRPAMGVHTPTPPSSPWQSLEEVKRRNDALRAEWEPRILQAQPAPAR